MRTGTQRPCWYARAQQHRRVALLNAVFTGGVVTDNTRWDITRLLDLPHDGTFAVVVAETSDPTGSACLDIERALDAIRMGSDRRLTPCLPAGHRFHWNGRAPQRPGRDPARAHYRAGRRQP